MPPGDAPGVSDGRQPGFKTSGYHGASAGAGERRSVRLRASTTSSSARGCAGLLAARHGVGTRCPRSTCARGALAFGSWFPARRIYRRHSRWLPRAVLPWSAAGDRPSVERQIPARALLSHAVRRRATTPLPGTCQAAARLRRRAKSARGYVRTASARRAMACVVFMPLCDTPGGARSGYRLHRTDLMPVLLEGYCPPSDPRFAEVFVTDRREVNPACVHGPSWSSTMPFTGRAKSPHVKGSRSTAVTPAPAAQSLGGATPTTAAVPLPRSLAHAQSSSVAVAFSRSPIDTNGQAPRLTSAPDSFTSSRPSKSAGGADALPAR